MMRAIEQNDEKELVKLFSQTLFFNPNQYIANGDTLLTYAIKLKRSNLVKMLLLDARLDTNFRTDCVENKNSLKKIKFNDQAYINNNISLVYTPYLPPLAIALIAKDYKSFCYLLEDPRTEPNPYIQYSFEDRNVKLHYPYSMIQILHLAIILNLHEYVIKIISHNVANNITYNAHRYSLAVAISMCEKKLKLFKLLIMHISKLSTLSNSILEYALIKLKGALNSKKQSDVRFYKKAIIYFLTYTDLNLSTGFNFQLGFECVNYFYTSKEENLAVASKFLSFVELLFASNFCAKMNFHIFKTIAKKKSEKTIYILSNYFKEAYDSKKLSFWYPLYTTGLMTVDQNPIKFSSPLLCSIIDNDLEYTRYFLQFVTNDKIFRKNYRSNYLVQKFPKYENEYLSSTSLIALCVITSNDKIFKEIILNKYFRIFQLEKKSLCPFTLAIAKKNHTIISYLRARTVIKYNLRERHLIYSKLRSIQMFFALIIFLKEDYLRINLNYELTEETETLRFFLLIVRLPADIISFIVFRSQGLPYGVMTVDELILGLHMVKRLYENSQ